MSNRLNPDQAQCSVGPDLDLNCLQRSSAEDLIFCENQDNSLEISGHIFNQNQPNCKT